MEGMVFNLSRIVSIASGKGGVGKSTIAAGISTSLAQKGYKVLAIDADIGLRNLDLFFGISNISVFDFSDVLYGHCSLEKAVVKHENIPNLSFLTAPQISTTEEIRTDALKSICQMAKKSYDFIIIDCPAGIGSGFINAAIASDVSLVVATPDHTSIRDADRAAGLIYERGVDEVRLIINRVRADLMKKGLVANVDDMIDGISLRLIGIVPEDEKVLIASNAGKPITLSKSKSKASKAIDDIAGRLTGEDIKIYKFWK